MNRVAWLLAVLVLGVLSAPGLASAQQSGAKPSNNMWTRSAALYIDRANKQARPDEKRALLEQALAAALESTENDAGNPRGWFLAGQVYIKLGNYSSADSMFDKAEALSPGYDEVRTERQNAWIMAYNQGVTALQGNKIEDAITNLLKADLIFDDRPQARLTLASLYGRERKADEAIQMYRGALEILRGPAAQELDAKEKEQWEKNTDIALFNLAQLLASGGRDEEAVQVYRDFLGRNPNDITAKVNLAVVLTRQGKTEEATQVYNELLARSDLTDVEYFKVGIGLFRSNDHVRAAEAFRKAATENPYSRDALYNLAQSLYVQSTELEEARETAKGEQAAKLGAELVKLYEELRDASEKVRQLDPYNRNVLALLARAYRGLGDLATDTKTSDAWKLKTLNVLRLHQDMPFEVDEMAMSIQEAGVTVSGTVTNLKLKAGAPVKLRVILLDAAGTALGAQEVTVTAPAAEQSTSFEVTLQAKEPAGWKYEVAS